MKISEPVEFLREVGGGTIRLTLLQAGRDLLINAVRIPSLKRRQGRVFAFMNLKLSETEF